MAPSHSGKSLPLEVRRSAEAEDLGSIEVGLEQGLGNVGAQRSKRRLPDEAETGRHAHFRAVEDETAFASAPARYRDGVDRFLARVPKGAGVEEDGALHADAVGDEGEREAYLSRGRPEHLTAERILGAVGNALAG